jgi:hypothetical protein
MTIGMNGLRIFIRPEKDRTEDKVFYSQRSHGPVYRWQYENHLARWHVARIDASHWGSHELCLARWQSVPKQLKAQLSEHYVE